MITISPTGLATTALVANQVSLLATYTEKLCNKVCVNSSIQPTYALSYSYDAPTLNGTTVFIPVVANLTISTPSCGCSGACSKTHIFTERFSVAIQGQSALPTSVTITSQGKTSNDSNVVCCKAGSLTINDSLTVLIA